MKKRTQKEKYVIGVDGGGTKTIAVLADLKGRVLRKAKLGSSSPRNIGTEKAVFNVSKVIKKVIKNIKKQDVILTLVALPAVEEEYKNKKEKIKELISSELKISKNKIIIASDQIAAFRSGTDKKDGVILIAGTGCVARGWRKGKEIKVSGWGWLADEGSAFWAGQKAYQVIFKDLDRRGPDTLLAKLVFQKWKIRNKEHFMRKIYLNPIKIIPLLSIFVDKAAQKGDKISCSILREAGKELAINVNTVIKKLNFQREEFPLVLVGGMFKSKIILDIVKKEIKKFAPKIQFILPKKEPVTGAVKLALDDIRRI